MNQPMIHPISPEFSTHAYLNESEYHAMYAKSLRDPTHFWSEQAEKCVTWFKRWDDVISGDLTQFNALWFTHAKLNACYNCVDRHLEKKSQQTAIIWQGDSPLDSKTLTYAEVYEAVCRLANVLKQLHIKKGDRVCIYLPMIPEAAIAMLACARIGAIHSVVFAGFSADALKTRITAADCKVVITANESVRGNKIIPLKKNVDEALAQDKKVQHVIVVKRTENETPWEAPRDVWYHEMTKTVTAHCPCEMIDANDPFFILYTSGSTGEPKGIVHAIGGYLVYVAMTYKYIFNYQEGDIYWCTADIGWITGHSYSIYGPLCQGATTLLFEGVPHYPNPGRYWEIIQRYQVNIFYTAPTAIRALRREGDDWIEPYDLSSLKLLGTVGEPINPDVWEWYYEKIGNGRCPIVDTWWQTETGGILISPLPGATPLKPGSAAWPFFGIVPGIIDDAGNPVPENTMGKLVIKQQWPGMLQTIYHNRARFENAYFKPYPGTYLTGDDAFCDSDGYYWITGRNDDVIKVSGHRISTGEVENAFLMHPAVSEVGVVAIPHDIKGESIYAFVCLRHGVKPSDALKKELIEQVRHAIGPIATPDTIQWAETLPKTRSGKIMRRLLRKIANKEFDNLGDTSTLADPEVIKQLIKHR